MIYGLLLALISGSLIGLQNIFNSKVNKRAGVWITTTIVLGMGFFASFFMGLLTEGKQFFILENMVPWYWFSGIIGVGVVLCLTMGVSILGPTYAISIVLTSQLMFALLFDTQGWLGLEKVPLSFKQLLGVLVIVSGILLFKLGGRFGKEVKQVA